MCSEEHQQLMRKHAADMHAMDEVVLDALFGPFNPALGLNVRDVDKGMQHQVEVLYCHTQNGGMPSKLTKADRRLIISIFTVTFGAVLSDILLHI